MPFQQLYLRAMALLRWYSRSTSAGVPFHLTSMYCTRLCRPITRAVLIRNSVASCSAQDVRLAHNKKKPKRLPHTHWGKNSLLTSAHEPMPCFSMACSSRSFSLSPHFFACAFNCFALTFLGLKYLHTGDLVSIQMRRTRTQQAKAQLLGSVSRLAPLVRTQNL